MRGARDPFPPKHANGDMVYLPRGQLASDVAIKHVAKISNFKNIFKKINS
jgi:hypothetical protein